MNLRPSIAIRALFLVMAGLACASVPTRGADAARLPDPLVFNDGTPVKTVDEWRDRRRGELLELFSREMYGRMPGRPPKMTFHVFDTDPAALGGLATRQQVRIAFDGTDDGPHLDLLLYQPNHASTNRAPLFDHGGAPVILGINFWGNHAIHPDPGIRITTNWMESGRNPYVDLSGVTNNRATEACRGINARQWPVERILKEGFALATFYRGDIAPDFPNGMTNGVMSLYPELQGRGDNFSTIGAWAWGLSRAMDYLVTVRRLGPGKVTVFGWSRLGKAALWAGANDERFAAVHSHESGAGGAKLFHRGVGEDIRRLNTVFPHWYCQNFRRYNGRDTELPFDQHMVLSLIAPRGLYVASASEDRLADAEGEFQSARAATPVYRLFGRDGLPTDVWPAVNQPVHGRIGYHVRDGNHDVTEYDWTQLLKFLADHYTRTGGLGVSRREK